MWAALLGFAGVSFAAIIGLIGVMRQGRAPAHQADVSGLSALVDQLQEERDRLQRLLDDCLRGRGQA